MPIDLTDRQVAFAILKWLHKQGPAPLGPALSVLQEQYDIALDSAECREQCDVGLDLDVAVQCRSGTRSEGPAQQEEKLRAFVAVLRKKGYFAGVQEGTPAYFERYETAKRKFMARNNPCEGLTPEQLKQHGNQRMAAGQYREAARYYTKAIELDPGVAMFYANRAAAFTHLKEYDRAVGDCETALRLEPKYSKALSRYGTALFHAGDYAGAVRRYAEALALEPDNTSYRSDLRAAEHKRALTGGSLSVADMAGMLESPEFLATAQAAMQQPQFRDLVAHVAGALPAAADGQPLADCAEMFTKLAEQQRADGSMPDVLTTPFGTIRREQLEELQHMPELQGNPKFQDIMQDVRTAGPLAMLKYMQDPQLLAFMTKLAGTLFPGAADPPAPADPPAALA